jgi:outer membrane protein assembly factor BamB
VRPTASCRACGATWPGRTSRFCGRCGGALTVERPEIPPPRLVAWLLVGAVGSTLFVVAGTTAAGRLTELRRGDPVVELPAPDDVVSGSALSEGAARAALAPFDPARPRCEPAGCERWRFDAPHGDAVFTAFGDLLAVHLDGHLYGLDPGSGEQRWAVPLSRPDGTDASPRAVREQVTLAADDAHVVVARGMGELRLVDTTGRQRWVITVPDGARVWRAQPVEDVVVTMGPTRRAPTGTPEELLHAFAVEDGLLRWTRAVEAVRGPLEELVVLDGEAGLVRLDPATGETAVSLGEDSWATRHGGYYLLVPEDGRPARLVSATTGATLMALQGLPAGVAVHRGRVYLSTVLPDDPAPKITITAMDEHGELRWERAIELPSAESAGRVAARGGAGTQVWVVDDVALAVHVQDVGPLRLLDLEDGTERLDVLLPPAPTDAWWVDGMAVVHRPDWHFELHGEAGTARIPARSTWLELADPPVVGGPRGLLGVDLVFEDG